MLEGHVGTRETKIDVRVSRTESSRPSLAGRFGKRVNDCEISARAEGLDMIGLKEAVWPPVRTDGFDQAAAQPGQEDLPLPPVAAGHVGLGALPRSPAGASSRFGMEFVALHTRLRRSACGLGSGAQAPICRCLPKRHCELA